jgi:sugar lactone lactonase YvrE
MSNELRVVYAGRAELAEGPVWQQGALWWVDIAVGTFNRLDLLSGWNSSRATGNYLGCAIPCIDGRWLLGRQQDCSFLNWETGETAHFVTEIDGLEERHRFNDGKCDPAGRFWVGSMCLDRRECEASLFCIDGSGEVRRVLRDVSLSNGMAWSPDAKYFYHIDTPTRRVERYSFDVDRGVLSEQCTLRVFDASEGWPDGMTCDAEGRLWVAMWGGGQVLRLDAQTGKTIARHKLPVSNVSSCTFGDDDLRTLYITTAWEGFTEAQRQAEPLAGSIFAVRTDVPGLPANLFRPD